MEIRTPPHSEEAEQSILGAVMYRPDVWGEVCGVVAADDFYNHRHRIIWHALESLASHDKPMDAVTVSEAISAAGEGEICPLSYVGMLANEVPSAANAKHYAEIVKTKADARKIIALCHRAASAAYADDPVKVYSQLAEDLEAINVFQTDTDMTMAEVMNRGMEYMRVAYEKRKRGGMVGVPTGIAFIDDRTGGLCSGRLVGVAARPSLGKTALILQACLHAAKSGHRVGMISLEMTDEEISARARANRYGLNVSKLLKGYADECSAAKSGDEQYGMHKWPMLFDFDSYTLDSIVARCSQWKRKHDVELIVVDHIGLVETDDSKTRNDQLGKVTRTLKKLSKRLDVAMVAVSQLSRSSEKEGRWPQLSDLRDSGNIEQDLDVAIFLDEGKRKIDGLEKRGHWLGFLKNRQGRKGWCREPFIFDGQTQRFKEISTEYERAA